MYYEKSLMLAGTGMCNVMNAVIYWLLTTALHSQL